MLNLAVDELKFNRGEKKRHTRLYDIARNGMSRKQKFYFLINTALKDSLLKSIKQNKVCRKYLKCSLEKHGGWGSLRKHGEKGI